MLEPNSKSTPELANGHNGAWNNEVDLFTMLGVIVKHRRMILRNVAGAAVFFLLLGLLWPASYLARATLLPPDGNQRESFLNLLSDSPLVPLTLPLAQSTSDLFVEILASRAVGEGVLRHPLMRENGASAREDSSRMTEGENTTTLMQYWEMESEEKALKRLYERTTLSTTEQGIIEIAVEMSSPQLAAEVANAFVAELDRVNREKNISAARNTRVYIEEQLALTSNKLSALADSLAQFQKQHGAVGMNEQMQAGLAQAGELQGNLIAKRIELEMMRRSMKAGNPAIAQMQAEITALEKQVQRLQFGGAETQQREQYFVAFAEIPELARRLAELTRELKAQETVWQLLNQQYYQAKISEARDTPTVQALDRAVPPEFRAKPKRLILLLTGTSAMLLLSLVFAFIKEYVSHVRSHEPERLKWQKLFMRVGDNDSSTST